MKNSTRLFGIIALVAIMTFAMIACSDGGGGSGSGSTSTKTAETATYVSYDENGNEWKLETSNTAYRATVIGSYYKLTISGPDGKVLATSTGTAKLNADDKNMIELTHSGGAFTITVSSSGNKDIIVAIALSEEIKDIKDIFNSTPVESVKLPLALAKEPDYIKVEGQFIYVLIDDPESRNNGTYNVRRSSDTISGALVIPASFNGKAVTEIAEAAFINTNITSVTIPSSVTYIGWSAFDWCTDLTSVTIPEGVTYIGGCTFRGTSLTSATIPASVTDIGWGLFNECTFLKSVTIPKDSRLIRISGGMFMGCTNFIDIAIPESVTSIVDEAFLDCTSLKNITIPSGVTIIGRNAFCRCTSLESITIPSAVTSLGNFAFTGCTSLKSVTFAAGSQLKTIGYLAFADCTGITSITIPNSVKEMIGRGGTSIGSQFTGWTSSQRIIIPFASLDEADNAWGGSGWREGCGATFE